LFASNSNSFIDKNSKFVNLTAKFPKSAALGRIGEVRQQKV